MEPSKHLRNVRQQYEQYPFPKRDPKDERKRLHVCEMEMLGKLNHHCYAGKARFDAGFRALVAGGGTGDSVVYLAHHLQGTGAEVVYLDMSEASMRTAQERARIRGLDNIRWVHASILDLPELGLGRFDYINCVGVLHHMADPDAGLRALAQVLEDDGAIGLMVYGKYGRLDIYATQDLMRLVNRGQPDAATRVANAKALLRCLPDSNILLRGRRREELAPQFLDDESNLYDAFLHEQDRSYTVPELYDFLDRAGLHLAQFTNYLHHSPVCRLEYDPALYIAQDSELAATVGRLPPIERQAVAEVINGCIGLHACYATRRENTVARFDDPDNVPYFLTAGATHQCRALAQRAPGEIGVNLRNGQKMWFEASALLRAFLEQVDGERSMREILAALAARTQGVDAARVLAALAADLELLNAFNWLVLRHRDAPPVPLVQVGAAFTLVDAG